MFSSVTIVSTYEVWFGILIHSGETYFTFLLSFNVFPFSPSFHCNGRDGIRKWIWCENSVLWWSSEEHLQSVDFEPNRYPWYISQETLLLLVIDHMDFCESKWKNEGQKQNIYLAYYWSIPCNKIPFPFQVFMRDFFGCSYSYKHLVPICRRESLWTVLPWRVMETFRCPLTEKSWFSSLLLFSWSWCIFLFLCLTLFCFHFSRCKFATN